MQRKKSDSKMRGLEAKQHTRDLHNIEQYALDLISAQYTTPREPDKTRVLLKIIHPSKTFLMVIILALLPINEYLRQNETHRVFSVVYSEIMGFIAFFAVLCTEFLFPAHNWWQSLRFGKYAVARIIDARVEPGHAAREITGTWEYDIGDNMKISPFRLDIKTSGAWTRQIKRGSEVHVLIHPVHSHVLKAIAVIDGLTPRIFPPIDSSLLEELLTTKPPINE